MKYFRLHLIAFLLICGINVSFGQILQPLTWNVRFESDGAEGTIIIDAQIERGWHLYATQLPEGGPIPTSITWDESRLRNVEIIGDLHPNRPAEENFDMFFHFYGAYRFKHFEIPLVDILEKGIDDLLHCFFVVAFRLAGQKQKDYEGQLKKIFHLIGILIYMLNLQKYAIIVVILQFKR